MWLIFAMTGNPPWEYISNTDVIELSVCRLAEQMLAKYYTTGINVFLLAYLYIHICSICTLQIPQNLF